MNATQITELAIRDYDFVADYLAISALNTGWNIRINKLISTVVTSIVDDHDLPPLTETEIKTVTRLLIEAADEAEQIEYERRMAELDRLECPRQPEYETYYGV